MSTIEKLQEFFERPDALERMASMACALVPEHNDQDYVARDVNNLLARDDNFALLQSRMDEFMRDSFDDVGGFVIDNSNIKPYDLAKTSQEFQDMYATLQDMGQHGGSDLAKVTMLYAVGGAYQDWQYRNDNGIPYDPEEEGAIKLASPKSDGMDLG